MGNWIGFSSILLHKTKYVAYYVVVLMVVGLIWASFYINWMHIINVDWQRLMLFDITSLLVLIIALWLYRHCDWNKSLRFVEWISTYSFEIYIVHNFFIHGTFCCSHLTDSVYVNVSIILLLTLLSAMLLKASANVLVSKLN